MERTTLLTPAELSAQSLASTAETQLIAELQKLLSANPNAAAALQQRGFIVDAAKEAVSAKKPSTKAKTPVEAVSAKAPIEAATATKVKKTKPAAPVEAAAEAVSAKAPTKTRPAANASYASAAGATEPETSVDAARLLKELLAMKAEIAELKEQQKPKHPKQAGATSSVPVSKEDIGMDTAHVAKSAKHREDKVGMGNRHFADLYAKRPSQTYNATGYSSVNALLSDGTRLTVGGLIPWKFCAWERTDDDSKEAYAEGVRCRNESCTRLHIVKDTEG